MNENFKKTLQHIQSDAPLRSTFLYGLSLLSKEALAEFQTVWPEIAAERRQKIMGQLVEIAEHSFEVQFDPVFILGLNDTDDQVQTKAIEGLWHSEEPTIIPALIHLLKTGKTIPVREAAAIGLGQFIYLGELEEIDETAYTVTHQALLQTIRNDKESLEVVRRSIEAIAFSSEPGIVQIIEYAYYHDEEIMQVSGVFAMGRHGDADRWGVRVLTELDNDNPKIRFEAVRAAGELSLLDTVPRLIQMLDQETDSEIVQSAIWSLGQIGGSDARTTLETLSESDDEALSSAAEDALEELLLWDNQELADLFDYMIGSNDDEEFHIVDLNGA